MEENNTNLILTTTELKNFIGKYVVCYYPIDYRTSHDCVEPNLTDEETSFKWLFKLTHENNLLEDNKEIRGIDIHGIDCVCLVDNQHLTRTAPYFLRDKTVSNAQHFVRTPTKEEMKKYMNIMRHRRIFGT